MPFIIPTAMFAMFLFLSYYFQNTLGETPRPLIIAGTASGILGYLYLAQLDSDSTWLAHVLPSELLIALGMGLVFVCMQAVALHRIDEKDSGVASALVNTAQQVGGSVGVALLSTIVAQVFSGDSGSAMKLDPSGNPIPVDPEAFIAASIHSYDVAFYWGAGFMGLALVVTVFMIRMNRHALGDETQNAAVVAKPEPAVVAD